MNRKKPLNIIRGWFPQEPLMLSRHFKVSSEPKPPLMIPAWSKTSAKKVAGVTAFFWLLAGVFFEILFLDLPPMPPLSQVLWILGGLASGAFVGVYFMGVQIKSFTKNYRSAKLTKKDMVIIGLPLVVIFVSIFVVPYFTGGVSAMAALVGSSGFWLFYVSLWLSRQLVMFFSYSAFEKRTNMRLVTTWTDTEVYVIPNHPNQSNDNAGKQANGV